MRIVTWREVVKDLPKMYRERFENWDRQHRFPDGTTIGQNMDALRALDMESCSPEDIAAIGLTGWVGLRCDECGKEQDALVRLGEEPDYEARWQDLCRECLQAALNLATVAK